MVYDLVIQQGKTFSQVVRWETSPIIYKAITGITKTAPALVTAVGHGVPDGWRVAIVSVVGMTQINAKNDPPKQSDYHQARVIDANTIELNDINAAGYSAYVSGGYVQYYTPVNLTGYTARMSIKDKVGGTLLLSLTTENGRILIDTVAHTVTLTISAVDTASIAWSKGVYDLEMVSPGGVVSSLLAGAVSVKKEVTT